ncbi:MAG: hypothetical protein DI533_06625 [Cereibacter sphaeroides]|uniref:Uncharacterized protein n=1 Tax=Cereibacter sphaeroides TaxID=1063 RepID=A0A2W5SKV7_CERSP|nr:MAG: hypothetical protein DI533_06625 [Cereibacter sphaeroides]
MTTAGLRDEADVPEQHSNWYCASNVQYQVLISSRKDGKLVEKDAAIDRFRRAAEQRAADLKARQDEAPVPPSVRSLCLDHTLYAEIQLNPERDEKFLKSLRFGAQQFDAHCVYCGQGATFRTSAGRMPSDVANAERLRGVAGGPDPKRLILEDGQFALHLWCSRRPELHLYSYFFDYSDTQGVLTKVGQKPSLEDVAGADIERYRTILGGEFAELRRATGLFAHGIGIGSFVYLRRIFENLVDAARSTADPKGEREAEFRKMRMTDRVSALAAHLPPAVVKYKDAYGILSLGVHELSEVDCKRYFPVVRAAVIMMLEQRYEAAEKAKVTAELDRAVAAIAQETKSTK